MLADVSFPSTDPPSRQPLPHSRTHLPFRRISLPTQPPPQLRHSTVSVGSVESFPDESASSGPSSVPAVMRAAARKAKRSSTSVEAARRKLRDLKPVDEAVEAKRRKIIYELYETEKAYVDGLELIYSHFLTPLIASLETPHPLLDRARLTSVFSNFIDIWNLHRSFFSSLHSLLSPLSPNSSLPAISPILVSHFPYLSLYTPFVTSFHTTITALTNMLSPSSPSYNQPFAAFIATREADPMCGKLKLSDWLLTIVQRCPRYLLLLKDLIGCTDAEETEYDQLTAVHALVSKITLSLNASLHSHAQTLTLLALQRSTSSLPSDLQFICPGRTFLRRGPLVMQEPSGEGRQREFLLFSDCLVWLESENGHGRPTLIRTRSKSEAELSVMRAQYNPPAKPDDDFEAPNPKRISVASSNPPAEEKWVFKGKAELVDLEIVVVGGAEEMQDRRFEILSPEGSFAVYAASQSERDEWSTAIRNAKASLLTTLNLTHPNSTLTSSSSTNHLRRSLQALPFPLHDERIGTIGYGYARGKSHIDKGKGKDVGKGRGGTGERRGLVEHWVPPVWIPDAKTEGCMRCGKGFGWRRRRHHCRLCGRCVCAACSGKTFFITDSSKDSSKPARACNACYDTVFPLLDPPTEPEEPHPPQPESTPYMNTIASLAGLPSWFAMPSFPLSSATRAPGPGALMALDRDRDHGRKRGRGSDRIDNDNDGNDNIDDHEIYANEGQDRDRGRDGLEEGEESNAEIGPRGRVRMKVPVTRPRSSIEILGDFGQGTDPSTSNVSVNVVPRSSARREDTARRSKRFSLPAVALQTTSVVARTTGGEGVGVNPGGAGKVKRFSLVLGGRVHAQAHGHGFGVSKSGDVEGKGRSVAAGKLSELLGRRRA